MEDQNQELAEKYFNSGIENSEKGQIELAIEDYTQAIKLKPDYADAYYCRSKAWLQIGEEEKAKSDMKTASEIGININTAIDELLHRYDRAWKTLGNISDI